MKKIFLGVIVLSFFQFSLLFSGKDKITKKSKLLKEERSKVIYRYNRDDVCFFYPKRTGVVKLNKKWICLGDSYLEQYNYYCQHPNLLLRKRFLGPEGCLSIFSPSQIKKRLGNEESDVGNRGYKTRSAYLKVRKY